MNGLKKLWCRTVQGAVRLAIPALPYRRPRRAGDVAELPALLGAEGVERVLVVTSTSVARMAGTERPVSYTHLTLPTIGG